MRRLSQIKRKICRREYIVTHHARERMKADDLNIFDMEYAVLNGKIRKKETDDPRGVKWEIVGPTRREIKMGVVVRFLPSDYLLIITAFARE